MITNYFDAKAEAASSELPTSPGRKKVTISSCDQNPDYWNKIADNLDQIYSSATGLHWLVSMKMFDEAKDLSKKCIGLVEETKKLHEKTSA